MIYRWFKRRRDLRKSEKERAAGLRKERESHVPEPMFNPFGRLADAVITQMNERIIAYEEQTQNEIREILGNIAVISFVGSSGTGKSTRAISVAREYHIDYIIDDGLLIHGGAIVAGSSAKRAESKMESVRQALFLDPVRAESMRRTLVERLPSALMILGTSDAMLSRICENLWLNQPSIKIRIEDVTTEMERNLAKQTRLAEGKHTIPVPSMEIKHEFSGSLIEPLARLWQRFDLGSVFGSTSTQNTVDYDRTVVRPTFSTLGSYAMSDQAMKDLVSVLALKVDGVEGVVDQKVQKEPYGVILSLDLAIYYGSSTQSVLAKTQTAVSAGVELLTAINVLATNVRAVRVTKERGAQSSN